MRKSLLLCSVLFTCLVTAVSCEKEEAYAIKCIGDDCHRKTGMGECLDGFHMMVDDGDHVEIRFCPEGCA